MTIPGSSDNSLHRAASAVSPGSICPPMISHIKGATTLVCERNPRRHWPARFNSRLPAVSFGNKSHSRPTLTPDRLACAVTSAFSGNPGQCLFPLFRKIGVCGDT